MKNVLFNACCITASCVVVVIFATRLMYNETVWPLRAALIARGVGANAAEVIAIAAVPLSCTLGVFAISALTLSALYLLRRN